MSRIDQFLFNNYYRWSENRKMQVKYLYHDNVDDPIYVAATTCSSFLFSLYHSIDTHPLGHQYDELMLRAEKCKMWLQTIAVRTEEAYPMDEVRDTNGMRSEKFKLWLQTAGLTGISEEVGENNHDLYASCDADEIQIWRLLKGPLDELINKQLGVFKADPNVWGTHELKVMERVDHVLFWFERVLQCTVIKYEAKTFLYSYVAKQSSVIDKQAIVAAVDEIFKPWVEWFVPICERISVMEENVIDQFTTKDKEKAETAATNIVRDIMALRYC
jgi:hypothetical protein